MIRLGMIGAGNFSYTHKCVIRQVEGCKICAISDLIEEKANALAEGIYRLSGHAG